VPILEGVTSWMLGRIIEVHPVFNNAVIVVQIETGALGPEDEALLYHERSYRSPGAVV
jgi:flavin reductase (DIM6/NTAB) family NADH-FMN oxidoreductase RutF